MKTSTMVAIGAGAVVAYLLLRPQSGGVAPIAAPSSALTGERIAAAAGVSRDRMIAEWMRRGVSREAAEARWNMAMSMTATSTGVRGIGGYYVGA
jgi:CBS-domain-containing membrane protein